MLSYEQMSSLSLIQSHIIASMPVSYPRTIKQIHTALTKKRVLISVMELRNELRKMIDLKLIDQNGMLYLVLSSQRGYISGVN